MGQIFLTTFLAFLVGNYLAQREVEAAREVPPSTKTTTSRRAFAADSVGL